MQLQLTGGLWEFCFLRWQLVIHLSWVASTWQSTRGSLRARFVSQKINWLVAHTTEFGRYFNFCSHTVVVCQCNDSHKSLKNFCLSLWLVMMKGHLRWNAASNIFALSVVFLHSTSFQSTSQTISKTWLGIWSSTTWLGDMATWKMVLMTSKIIRGSGKWIGWQCIRKKQVFAFSDIRVQIFWHSWLEIRDCCNAQANQNWRKL